MIDRVDLQPAFVLHRRPFRNSSLLVEAFSPEYGRLGLVANGVRRPRAPWGSALQPFRANLLSWSGRGDLKTLVGLEPTQDGPALEGRGLLSGFYLNELLLRLLPRDDPHPALFRYYAEALMELGRPEREQPALRRFEQRLLRELGYGLVCDHAIGVAGGPTDARIDATAVYAYRPEAGPQLLSADAAPDGRLVVRGCTLHALAAEDLHDPDVLTEARGLMRSLLAHYLGDRPLQSRELFREYLRLREPAQQDS